LRLRPPRLPEQSFMKIKSDGKGVRQMQPEQQNSLESV
jgi:hypothetical protein